MHDLLMSVNHATTDPHHLIELAVFSKWLHLSLLAVDVCLCEHRLTLTMACKRHVLKILFGVVTRLWEWWQNHLRLLAHKALDNVVAV
jgi:hypothetical protein